MKVPTRNTNKTNFGDNKQVLVIKKIGGPIMKTIYSFIVIALVFGFTSCTSADNDIVE